MDLLMEYASVMSRLRGFCTYHMITIDYDLNCNSTHSLEPHSYQVTKFNCTQICFTQP